MTSDENKLKPKFTGAANLIMSGKKEGGGFEMHIYTRISHDQTEKALMVNNSLTVCTIKHH